MFVFLDTSMKAYGAVVNLCLPDQVTLVMSKSRATPTKTVTLLKLELMAAVMATRLATLSCLHCTIMIYPILLTYGRTVRLYYIGFTNKHQKVIEIVDSFPPTKWSFSTPTADNPADLLTRGASTQQLLASQFWS